MSYQAALLSAGGAIETCKNVVTGQVKNAFAVIRPPGHHAEFDAPMGFCFFNNVPVAVRVCQQDYPDICRKVLILDWDVHHGNGVQNIFYQDPNVLYISLHVYQNGLFYPGKPPNDMTPDGGIDKCGTDAGLGKNINIGWHDQGMGDGEYMAAFQKIVMPIAKEFNPDLVVISAGFDAADGDELGGCFVSPSCYAHMTHMLMSLADGKVAVCLEGGYNLKAISVSAVAVAKTLMGEPPPKMEIPKINKEAARILAKVQAHQAPYWECMRAGIVRIPTDIQPAISSRLHDVIRNAQRQVLQTKHNMIPLYIQREHLYKSYENQVLVTPGLHKEKKVLIIIHDPPELLAQPDVIDRSVDPHNAWVVDGVTDYIDWAVDQKFGVMDVNIPAYVTHDEESDSYVPGFKEKALTEQIQTLVCYLWDNYLQLYDADHIFVMGVGNAYLGVKVLLINRDCKSRISGVVNFANGTLRPVKSEFDSDLSSWYKENSRVYIAGDHACWADPDLTRKVNKRRFGTVVRSPMFGLNKMMAHHAKEAREWILERVEEVADADMTEDEKS
ncbi:Histone deacetylase hda1, variant 2 [Fusarium oxysporum]|nr:Histone deacetylase hda1, variant 2 [Fusarium oxysporum]KAJ4031652.1 Histone deacetylase hda1, variant 2 [Fusarium oxysporum]KAJ4215546.1 Histone deacetylase hda1, variant 2 [Fusarium oxysporum]KAJ4267998.1 Histone deacetylase hda1 [Fusarium oxysporum]